MMAFSESVDLTAQLLTVKHAVDAGTLFPQHAFARGGVGHFLCTGQSRAGLNRLPQAASQAAALSLTARGRLQSTRSGAGGSEADSSISGFSLISTDPISVGATPAWEAGTAQHAANFVASCRTMRPTDIRAGSKWASMSYFENSPREVARHMAKMDHLQAVGDAIKAADRQTEQARHNIWAEQQRGTFRRQRLEQVRGRPPSERAAGKAEPEAAAAAPGPRHLADPRTRRSVPGQPGLSP
ncbi:hypothetical protein TSOC_005189 [Tetrabaena socialis]|uniref:Uncharacterized protein n=1 Tax=Tetrabaena socialis TaxID=47790 RepID=A0A2J8A6Y3_9CHLO|nr:hypothetical protein TSOC_005189 [Tetrabaena socialis]|eukprot:PNH08267.1 hypothetical protein TSOC_005189 [Tetrabaena socialis]